MALNRGAGPCDIAIAVDTASGPVPTAGEVAAARSYIASEVPVIGSSNAYAVAADALAITIPTLLPNTSTIRTAITAALEFLAATVPPGGASFGDAVTVELQGGALFPIQTPGVLYLNMIHTAIQYVVGGVAELSRLHLHPRRSETPAGKALSPSGSLIRRPAPVAQP